MAAVAPLGTHSLPTAAAHAQMAKTRVASAHALPMSSVHQEAPAIPFDGAVPASMPSGAAHATLFPQGQLSVPVLSSMATPIDQGLVWPPTTDHQLADQMPNQLTDWGAALESVRDICSPQSTTLALSSLMPRHQPVCVSAQTPMASGMPIPPFTAASPMQQGVVMLAPPQLDALPRLHSNGR